MANLWKPGEKSFRTWELSGQTLTAVVGVVILLFTARSAAAAAASARAATENVKQAQVQARAAANEARYASAMQALGGDFAAQRVAGFTLLRRNVEDRLRTAGDASSRADALSLYQDTLDVYENYLKYPPAPGASSVGPSSPQNQPGGGPAERQFGSHARPQDQIYAAGSLRALLGADDQALVHRLDPHYGVSMDLSFAPIYGQSWAAVDFSWLESKFLNSIDLRGSNLRGSKWGKAALVSARFQCANLGPSGTGSPTDLEGADLRDAQLQGANLQDADLRGANLKGANLTGAYVQGMKMDGAQVDDGTDFADVIGSPADRVEPTGASPSDQPSYDVGTCLDAGVAHS